MGEREECSHHIDWKINHAAFGDTNINYLEIQGKCSNCHKIVKFRGAPLGLSPNNPTMEVGGSEVRLPFIFEDENYDGKDIGFDIRLQS